MGFASCPKCGGKLTASTFETRGNEPFYNVVAEQYAMQPLSTDKEKLSRNPNAGKKVILFPIVVKVPRESHWILLIPPIEISCENWCAERPMICRRGVKKRTNESI